MSFVISTCKECPKQFKRKSKKHTFCSSLCSQAYWRKQGRQSFSKDIEFPRVTVGAIAELEVATFFLKNGWGVFRALSYASWSDLIVMNRKNRGKLYALEVRTGHINLNGKVTFPKLENDKGKIFAVVVHGLDKIFLFDFSGNELSLSSF